MTWVLLGHGSETTTARAWQGELCDSEEDTCDLLQEVVEVVEVVEEKRVTSARVMKVRDVAM